MKTKCLCIPFALGLGLALALVWLSGGGSPLAYAQGPDSFSIYYVALSCTGVPEPCYTAVQDAVDAADDPSDVIKITAGTYLGVSARPAPPGYEEPPASGLITQVVYISKTVSICGGYDAAFTDPPDTEANPTTLEAEGQGRVLLVAGNITPTIRGLHISGGTAAGLGGSTWESETQDAGGGVYVISATAVIRDNRVFNNSAFGEYCTGGGLYLCSSNATVSGNVINNNTANYGGGLGLYRSAATLSGNTVANNGATSGGGGGLYLYDSDATLSGNTVANNGAIPGVGGGLYLYDSDAATLNGNTICSNHTYWGGGGLQLSYSDATLINNIVADNFAQFRGNGLDISDSSPHLLHTTIARNSGDGWGVYVTDNSAVELVNTVLVSHSVGISVTSGSSAELQTTLWGSGAWANDTNWGGSGTINHSDDQTGDPVFVDVYNSDYHIGLGSAAIDAGVDAGVSSDIDGDPRPAALGFDIGADEYYHPALEVVKEATPDSVELGASLTYTIQITNTGNVDLHATITDTLPFSITLDQTSGGTLALPGGTVLLPDGAVAITWTAVITAPGDAWMGTVLVTVDENYAGSLTNLVEVTTKEGAAGVDSVTVRAGPAIYLPLVMRNFP